MHACMPLFVPPNHRSRLKKNNHRRPRAAVASMDDGCADAIGPSSTRPSSTRPASRTNAVDRSLARRASRSNPPRARRRGDRRMTIAPPLAISIRSRSGLDRRASSAPRRPRASSRRASPRAREKNKTKYPARVDVRLETDVASREARRVVVVPCAEECRRAAIRAGRRGRPWACVYPVVWFES